MALTGRVHGGQQGVSGSTIQLYTVGSSGNGSAATAMLRQAVTTDASGLFTITDDYACGKDSTGATISSAGNQVYIVASGGNPGLKAGTNNAALVLMAALGPCSQLSSTQYILINEVTTAAAAWALAPFAKAANAIGTTSTNGLGIANAFLDADLLADTSDGMAATLPANLTIETGKLYALADALASCVNSDGGTGCAPLFTAATPVLATASRAGAETQPVNAAPKDTFAAALNIVQHPGQNVAAVYAAIGSDPPFPTTLAASPNDWTMSLNVSGGGLFMPTALGVDSQGNVWVANQAGPLSAFNAQGTPLSDTGFGGSDGTEIVQVSSLAIDTDDNIWVVNYNGYQGTSKGSVTEFYGTNHPGQLGVSPQPMGYSDGSLQYPDAIAADTNGNVFIASTGQYGDSQSGTATVYSDAGALVYGGLGSDANLGTIPQGIAVDSSHGFWLPGDNYVAHISASSSQYPMGQLLSNTLCCAFSYGVATDAAGNLWVADYLGGTTPGFNEGAIADIGSDGSLLLSNLTGGGINHPAMVAVDSAQNAWFTNFTTGSITEVSGNGGAAAAGAPISPSVGTYGQGGYGLDAGLDAPFSIVPDRSGNVWVSNQSVDSVTMFFGLAAPTATPIQPVPTLP